jgi:peptidoglycan/LPS O-acetylase OafA/YrhL
MSTSLSPPSPAVAAPLPSARPRAGADSGYMKQLDGLRGLAVLAVVISHFPPSKMVEKILPWGTLGVQLFFVLSGFLITGILLRSKDLVARGEATRGSMWRSFYGRRMLRIFPLYYATLLVLYVFDLCQVRPVIGHQAAYLINFKVASTGLKIGDTTHFWSLAVEEQFYLVWPWIILLVPYRWLTRVLVAFTVSGPLYRLLAGILHWNVYATIWIPVANFDTLCGGALLALASHRAELRPLRDRWNRVALWGGALGVAAFSLASALHKERYGLTIVGLGLFYTPLFMALVDRAAQGRTGRWGPLLEWRPLVYLGQISYCVYIIHFLFPDVFDRLARLTGVPWLAASTVPPIRLAQMGLATLLAASLSRRWFELPFQRLKRLFPYQQRVVRATTAASDAAPAAPG